ncbi:hypothetical protein Z945_617 [Sulfitobacter noctilucae]|nr:hypothetical protein Z945_617 [Sulfitobacter noctilucae]
MITPRRERRSTLSRPDGSTSYSLQLIVAIRVAAGLRSNSSGRHTPPVSAPIRRAEMGHRPQFAALRQLRWVSVPTITPDCLFFRHFRGKLHREWAATARSCPSSPVF